MTEPKKGIDASPFIVRLPVPKRAEPAPDPEPANISQHSIIPVRVQTATEDWADHTRGHGIGLAHIFHVRGGRGLGVVITITIKEDYAITRHLVMNRSSLEQALGPFRAVAAACSALFPAIRYVKGRTLHPADAGFTEQIEASIEFRYDLVANDFD